MASYSSSNSSATVVTTILNVWEFVLRTLTAITVKLNENNYLLWTQSFRVFVGTQRIIKHLFESLSNEKDLSMQINFLMIVVQLLGSLIVWKKKLVLL